jgi:hypothetical protein
VEIEQITIERRIGWSGRRVQSRASRHGGIFLARAGRVTFIHSHRVDYLLAPCDMSKTSITRWPKLCRRFF